MKQLGLEEIKKYSFEILCEIKKICEANHLSYSLTGGTLLGAIRHKGIIPWDDDIDVMMPRPDYDRFLQIAKGNEHIFELCSPETKGINYGYPFAKACHKETVLFEKGIVENKRKLGVYVDIFPIDGAGNNMKSAKIHCFLVQVFHGMRLTANWDGYRKSKLRRWYFEPIRYTCYLISKMFSEQFVNNSLDKLLRCKKYGSSRYAGRLVGDFASKEIMDRDVFEKIISVEFENEFFSAIKEYDTFLTQLYGDYMKLPPVEKQVTHHQFDAYKK